MMSFYNNKCVICIIITITITFGLTYALENPIAFTAIKGQRNGPYISFQTLVVNNTAKFNSQYGVFMCTEPGLYFFTFSALSQKDVDFRISMRTNRIPVVTAYCGSEPSYNMATASTLLQLERDDIVYLFIEEGEFYESTQINRAYISFTGFQISKAINGGGGGFFSMLMGRNIPTSQDSLPPMDSGNSSYSTAPKPNYQQKDFVDEGDDIYQYMNMN